MCEVTTQCFHQSPIDSVDVHASVTSKLIIPLPFWYKLQIETFLLRFSSSSIYCEPMIYWRSPSGRLEAFSEDASASSSMLAQFPDEVTSTEVIYLRNSRMRVCPRFLESKNGNNRTNCRYLHPDFLNHRWIVPDLTCHKWFRGV